MGMQVLESRIVSVAIESLLRGPLDQDQDEARPISPTATSRRLYPALENDELLLADTRPKDLVKCAACQ